jgi:hypothetical protein
MLKKGGKELKGITGGMSLISHWQTPSIQTQQIAKEGHSEMLAPALERYSDYCC